MFKSAVYPFDLEFEPLIRHYSLLADYRIEALISPEGWGLTDRTFYSSDKSLSLTCGHDFKNGIERCDALIITDSRIGLDFDEYLYPEIEYAAKAGKKIVVARTLSKKEKDKLSGISKGNISFVQNSAAIKSDFNFSQELYAVDTPLVFVMGTSERADKFEIQLALREELLKAGYNVSQMASRKCCEMLNIHSFPDFMADSRMTEDDKIIAFNRYIKWMEEKEKPDIILVGIPGGVMPFNNVLTNKFGITAFEISQAVKPDYVILSSLYEDYENDYFEKIGQGIHERLGIDVDCNNIANSKLDMMESMDEKNMSYVHIDPEFVIDKIKKYKGYNDTVFDIYEEGSAKRMTEKMLDRLSAYSYVKSI